MGSQIRMMQFELNPQFLDGRIRCMECSTVIPVPVPRRDGTYMCTHCNKLVRRQRPWPIPDLTCRGPMAQLVNTLCGTIPQEESDGTSNESAGGIGSTGPTGSTRNAWGRFSSQEGTKAQDSEAQAVCDTADGAGWGTRASHSLV